jgi:hypothetical protein
MKVSILLLPILAGLGMASVIIKVQEQALEQALEQEVPYGTACCNTTPCFGGCPVHGHWEVSSYCLTDRHIIASSMLM